jgi:putative glycosyltransferase (TIGR04372 family)
MVPPGWLFTFSKKFLAITKHHVFIQDNRELTLHEIFSNDLGFCVSNSEYQAKGVRLEDNTPDEIRDVVIEMAKRLEGDWLTQNEDDSLQSQFWEIYPVNAAADSGVPYHGEIRSRYGSNFLRNNSWWLL